MDNNVFFRLKSERERLKIGQAQVADKTNVSLKTVGRWEKEIAIPSDKLSLLAELGFDLLYILTGHRQSIVQATPLDSRERALLTNYRESDDTGKRAVEAAASALAGGVSKSKASSE